MGIGDGTILSLSLSLLLLSWFATFFFLFAFCCFYFFRKVSFQFFLSAERVRENNVFPLPRVYSYLGDAQTVRGLHANKEINRNDFIVFLLFAFIHWSVAIGLGTWQTSAHTHTYKYQSMGFGYGGKWEIVIQYGSRVALISRGRRKRNRKKWLVFVFGIGIEWKLVSIFGIHFRLELEHFPRCLSYRTRECGLMRCRQQPTTGKCRINKMHAFDHFPTISIGHFQWVNHSNFVDDRHDLSEGFVAFLPHLLWTKDKW